MATRTKPQIRVGIGGWTYAPWRGVFYPEDLTQKRELEYASRQLTTIEINGTYADRRPAASNSAYKINIFSIKSDT